MLFSLEFSFFLFCDKFIYFFISELNGLDSTIVLVFSEVGVLYSVLKASSVFCLIFILILQFELILTQYFITKVYIWFSLYLSRRTGEGLLGLLGCLNKQLNDLLTSTHSRRQLRVGF